MFDKILFKKEFKKVELQVEKDQRSCLKKLSGEICVKHCPGHNTVIFNTMIFLSLITLAYGICKFIHFFLTFFSNNFKFNVNNNF